VAAITAATVVIVGVEQGIILAIAISILEHIHHSYRPHDTLMARADDGAIHTAPLADGTQLLPGLAAYRFGASLYYANAARFTEEIMELSAHADPPLRWVAVVGSAIGDIDYSGADAMRQVHEELEGHQVTLVLADMGPGIRKLLDAYGLTDRIGLDHIFDSIGDAIAAYQRLGPSRPASAAGDAPPRPTGDAPSGA
jgi:MFS superfamily sulfate permease-like transporter